MQSIQFLLRGGFMMYPLLFSGVLALFLIIDRLIFFRKIKTPGLNLKNILALIKEDKIPEAKKACESSPPTPLLSLCQVSLQNRDNLGAGDLENSLTTESEEWLPLLERRLDTLDTIITAAPLMGLLGTITGMMSSFQVLSEKGVNEPSAITGGVAEALIATATGLVIALLCLVAFNYFNNRVRLTLNEMEKTAGYLLNMNRPKK